ncbi:hypothetical protein LTR10_001008 [Elasticomyces elasticus]|nr:hypothetical protein LTR10_001008 [Elasticomyces elasticus]KAK4979743.1 hypothetical protein LTR42_000050 [Elasticomyces elasticus]
MAPHYEQIRDAANTALLTDLSMLLTSGKHTDLKIKLGDHIWNVHKNIVCARSDFFVKACEGKFKEADDGVVEIHDDDPTVIDKMIHYIYKTEYDDADTEVAPVLLNVRVVAAAEKYFVKFLAPFAVSKLKYHVEGAWETDAFVDAIGEAYTTTHDSDRELRDTLLKVVVGRANMLFNKEFEKYAHFQDMAAKTPSFSMEVAAWLAASLEKHTKFGTYCCPNGGCEEFRSNMEEGSTTSWECGQCSEWVHSKPYEWWQNYRLRDDSVAIPVD